MKFLKDDLLGKNFDDICIEHNLITEKQRIELHEQCINFDLVVCDECHDIFNNTDNVYFYPTDFIFKNESAIEVEDGFCLCQSCFNDNIDKLIDLTLKEKEKYSKITHKFVIIEIDEKDLIEKLNEVTTEVVSIDKIDGNTVYFTRTTQSGSGYIKHDDVKIDTYDLQKLYPSEYKDVEYRLQK